MKKSPLTMGGDFFMPLGNQEFIEYEEIFSPSYLAVFYALPVYPYMS